MSGQRPTSHFKAVFVFNLQNRLGLGAWEGTWGGGRSGVCEGGGEGRTGKGELHNTEKKYIEYHYFFLFFK